MKDFAFVIQARLGSSRLPGKILLAFGGSTVLGTIIDRLLAFGADRSRIVVATTDNPIDDVTEGYAERRAVVVYRGDEDNVLGRFQRAAASLDARHIVRLTADNPLLDLTLIAHCMRRHEESGSELTSTRRVEPDGRIVRFVPKGSSVDILLKSSLLSIDPAECSAFDREHVIPYFFRTMRVALVDDYASERPDLSIDTLQDYARVSRLAERYL